MQPVPSLKYNFPSLSKTLRCEMCTIRSSCRTEYLLYRAIQAELVMPFLQSGFDHDNPVNELNEYNKGVKNIAFMK